MPRKLIIDDFTGGRNTLDALPMVGRNQHSVGQNVWCPSRALRRRGGYDTFASNTSGLVLLLEQFKLTALNSGSPRLVMVGRVAAHSQRYLAKTDDGAAMALTGYRAGTVGTAGLSTTVTGSGTTWTGNVRVGDYLIPSGGSANRITAVNSNTEIVVTDAVNLTAGTSYIIIQAIALNSICAMASFNVSSAENLFIHDGGTTGKFRYDGTDVFVVSAMPNSLIALLPFKNYLFGLTTTGIRWSAISDGTTWPAANSYTFTNAGDPIRGGIVYGGYIVIFTSRRMWRLIGDTFDPSNPTYVLEEIPVPLGFVFSHPRSAVEHLGVLKFLTDDGWFAYEGSRVEKISQAIQADVDAFAKPFLAAETIANSAIAVVLKNRMFCAVQDTNHTPASALNALYVHDERGSWWKMPIGTGSDTINDLIAIQFAAGNYFLYGATNKTGYSTTTMMRFQKIDDLFSSAETINASWESKEFTADNELTFVEMIVTMRKMSSGNLTGSFSIDRATYVDFTLDMTAGVGTVIQKRVPIGRSGKGIRVKIAQNDSGQPGFEIYKIEVAYEASEGVRI